MKFNIKIICIAALTVFMTGFANAAITEDGSYSLDPDHAHIGFNVAHLGISKTVGRFNQYSGEFVLVSGGASSVDFTIQVDSVDTNQARRDKHLRSDDFFDVDRFETIRFKSTEVTYNADGDPEMITGDLALHGVTRPVSFNIKAVGGGVGPQDKQRAGYTATTSIRRSEFEMNEFAAIVGDDVEITVNIEMIKN